MYQSSCTTQRKKLLQKHELRNENYNYKKLEILIDKLILYLNFEIFSDINTAWNSMLHNNL